MYNTLKLLHIFGVVLFLGNVITAVLWKTLADRTRDARVIVHTLDGLIAADRYFTTPGVGLIIVTGISLVVLSGGWSFLGTTWIWQSLVLFGIAGAVFMFSLAPLQRRMREVALAGARGSFDRVTYERLSKLWTIWGALATLAPLAALGLMVLKPTF